MSKHKAQGLGALVFVTAVLASDIADAAPLFAEYSAIATGSNPEAVAIGDVNNDGRSDIVMTTSFYFDAANDYKLFVFAQGASGSFAPAVKYATAGTYTARPATVDIGDVNGDGLNDVVVGHSGSAIEIFRQTDGQLVASATLATPYSHKIRIGDLNRDGRQDVAGIGWGGAEVGVFLQDATGSLSLTGAFYAPHGGYDDLELGDVNGDSLTDIVVMSGQGSGYPNLAVLTQTLSGSFSSATYYAVGGNEMTHGVGVGDVDSDGLDDVVASYGGNRPSAYLAVLRQNDSGALETAQTLQSYDIPEPVVVRDVNGDRRDDIVVLHGGWNRMGVYLQQADGTLAPEELYPIPYASHYNPHGLAIGDYDGDRRPDVAIADYNHGLVLLKNVGPASINTPPAAVLLGPSEADRTSATTFDGSTSSDNDGDSLTFQWHVDGADAGTEPTLRTTFGELGSHVVSLTVSDGIDVATASREVAVHNLVPSVDAGSRQTVSPGCPVTLTGMAIDDDGTIVSYRWRQTAGPAVTLKGADTPVATFDAPLLGLLKNVQLKFRLQAVDNDGSAATATTVVTVARPLVPADTLACVIQQ